MRNEREPLGPRGPQFRDYLMPRNIPTGMAAILGILEAGALVEIGYLLSHHPFDTSFENYVANIAAIQIPIIAVISVATRWEAINRLRRNIDG